MALDPGNLLSYGVWLSLPRETRQKLATMFGFTESVVRETVDGRVICDGFAHASLAVITKERMREETGETSDDFYKLFNDLLDIVEGRKEKITHHVEQKEQEAAVTGTGKKRGRPAKGAK